MATNEEVLGPRKTMFVLVIVVGCFAVLWPRILSPLLLGSARDQLQPNQLDRAAAIKQERPPIRGAGPHPALRERGRAIPPGTAPPSPQVHIQMPPNVRVRTSPLSGYFELDIKPPPIPGMRPPLGSPGGPVPAPKTSMGFVMPIYTICIIVFFVYTISKLFFKRATIPYEPVTPDPQFRRRVFRDDSRSSPDKLGDVELEALRARLAETERAMQRIVGQLARRDEDVQDNGRPYTNGTIIHNSGPVHIFTSEYNENKAKDPSPETKEPQTKTALEEVSEEPDQEDAANVEIEKDGISQVDPQVSEVEVQKDSLPEKIDVEVPKKSDEAKVPQEIDLEVLKYKDSEEVEDKVPKQSEDKVTSELDDFAKDFETEQDITKEDEEIEQKDTRDLSPTKEKKQEIERLDNNLIDLTEPIELKRNGDIGKTVEDFLREEAKDLDRLDDETSKELIAAADDDDDDEQKSSVKVMGMELTAHSADGAPQPAPAPPQRLAPQPAEEVKSIFLETAIPQQSRVLVADFAEDHSDDTLPHRHSPMVVSGKMTLSLIQDAPRDTPERDLESTLDDFTTASALTQAAEKEGSESEEEVEEEIEVEEIEEEVEEEELEEETPEQGITLPGNKGIHPEETGKQLEQTESQPEEEEEIEELKQIEDKQAKDIKKGTE